MGHEIRPVASRDAAAIRACCDVRTAILPAAGYLAFRGRVAAAVEAGPVAPAPAP